MRVERLGENGWLRYDRSRGIEGKEGSLTICTNLASSGKLVEGYMPFFIL